MTRIGDQPDGVAAGSGQVWVASSATGTLEGRSHAGNAAGADRRSARERGRAAGDIWVGLDRGVHDSMEVRGIDAS